MTANENFKNALKEGNLADALVIALSKATELKITTSIVSANDFYGKNPQLHPEDCLETKINLLKGEIENKIGENLLKSELYNKLQDVHLKETIEGNQIIEQNLETLQKLFTILAEIKQQQLQLKNPEIVSFYLGNQLPPSPPPINYNVSLKKETITNQKSTIIDTENILETRKKEPRKPPKRTQRYDWQTLTESIASVEIVPDENQEIPIENLENKDLIEEDWGDLIIDENPISPVSNEPLIESRPIKEKNIHTDTTVISTKEIDQLITDENIAQITADNSDEQTEEEEIIEQFSVVEDRLNFDTKVMSESDLKAFVAEEQKRKSALENKENFSSKKVKNNAISEQEINDLLEHEDWGDLIEDSDEIETNSEDWDQVIGDLYEQKSSPNKDKK